ncbi:MAG: cupin domain-containing protein [Desulfuromonadales bacterium]|nr:cupin domain-containing protein [Desulfuromonadales bacterium]
MSTTTAKIHINPAEATDLGDLVPYQDGAVVSRTLLQHDTGTLTVFSFDAGQALSEHTVPFHAFVQVLDGTAEIIIGGQPVAVAAGQLVLMPGGISHEVKAHQRFKMLLTLFRATSAEQSEFLKG